MYQTKNQVFIIFLQNVQITTQVMHESSIGTARSPYILFAYLF